MDEQAIAAQVAQNIETEKHIPAPVTAQEPQPSAFESNIELNDRLLGLQLSDYFALERGEIHLENVQQQMRTVYEWAAETAQSRDYDKVLSVVRALENELGINFVPDRLTRLARFIQYKKQSNILNMQIESLRG